MFAMILTTGEEMDSEACEPFIERASTELNYSDMIINGDLLRFKEQQDLENFPTITGK